MRNHCVVCGQVCNLKFCSDECCDEYEYVQRQTEDEDEPADIDSDFGYDPYAGGPEPLEYDDYDY